jgi:hypothetical protein
MSPGASTLLDSLSQQPMVIVSMNYEIYEMQQSIFGMRFESAKKN